MRPVNIKELQAKSKELNVRLFDPARSDDPYTAIVTSKSNGALNQIVTIRFERNGQINARCTCTWASPGAPMPRSI